MYFYKVHAQANKDSEVSFFIPLYANEITKGSGSESEENSQSEAEKGITPLTPELVKQDSTYKDFESKNRPKLVCVDYDIYETDEDFSKTAPSELFDFFTKIIDKKEAFRKTGGEFEIAYTKSKSQNAKTAKKRGKKKNPKITYAIFSAAAVFALIIGVVIGKGTGGGAVLPSETGGENLNYNGENANEDGLIMPPQAEINPDAQQIAVTIDRSYRAVPKEDIQLKGEITDGGAEITLPYFDRENFFVHVKGYSWGFTSDPDGEKIEYFGGETYRFTQNTKLYRVLVKYGGGNGTKDDPFIINYFDQLELLSSEKARGYFRQTDDITFPENSFHTPINTVNELKTDPTLEYFEYDGGGFQIENLPSPLFGKVSGALIQNVNIVNSFIETSEYKNLGFIVCEAYNYRFEANGKTYETGETIVKNCTVSFSGIFAQNMLLDENGNPVVQTAPPPETAAETPEDGGEEKPLPSQKQGEYALGSITGLGGQIENCYVSDVAFMSILDDYFVYAGGISGKPANVKNCGVYHIGIAGKIFNAGGIAGSGGGSRFYNAAGEGLPDFYGGSIQGCFVRNFEAMSELCAGGIVGEGGAASPSPVISNSYASELSFSVGIFADDGRTKPIKYGISGGIIGVDGKEKFGHVVTNTVSLYPYSIIGSQNLSSYQSETVWQAPEYAFYQESILDVLNKNTVNPNAPGEIFTGNFVFDETKNLDENGLGLPFPEQISGLFDKVYKEGDAQNEQ